MYMIYMDYYLIRKKCEIIDDIIYRIAQNDINQRYKLFFFIPKLKICLVLLIIMHIFKTRCDYFV